MQAVPGQAKERAATHREHGRNFPVYAPVAHFGKKVARLEKMVRSENPQVASLAAIVLRVAREKPYRDPLGSSLCPLPVGGENELVDRIGVGLSKSRSNLRYPANLGKSRFVAEICARPMCWAVLPSA